MHICYITGRHMPESITITLPKDMSLGRRISEASRRLSEWLGSFGRSIEKMDDRLQLTQYKMTGSEYAYQYSIINRKALSAADTHIPLGRRNSSSVADTVAFLPIDGSDLIP